MRNIYRLGFQKLIWPGTTNLTDIKMRTGHRGKKLEEKMTELTDMLHIMYWKLKYIICYTSYTILDPAIVSAI